MPKKGGDLEKYKKDTVIFAGCIVKEALSISPSAWFLSATRAAELTLSTLRFQNGWIIHSIYLLSEQGISPELDRWYKTLKTFSSFIPTSQIETAQKRAYLHFSNAECQIPVGM